MNRKLIIFGILVVVLLAVAAGIAVQRVLSRPVGLTAPIPLVNIPAGEFMMGSPEDEEGHEDNERQHQVRINYPFQMGKTEVTQKQWREIMGTTIQQQRDKEQYQSSIGERLKKLGKAIKAVVVGEERWPLPGKGDDYPMYYVNWDEATEFCKKLTEPEGAAGRLPAGHEYRLPSEAEWEYACRAGSTTLFANGDTDDDLA